MSAREGERTAAPAIEGEVRARDGARDAEGEDDEQREQASEDFTRAG